MGTEKLLDSEVQEPSELEVKTKVQKVIGEEVISAKLINKGVINFPFEVETKGRKLFAKIYSRKEWPEPDKPAWVAGQLGKHNVSHARQIFYDRTDALFPCGIEITEYIEGEGADDAIRSGEITYEQFCTDVTSLLHEIHQIEAPRYGSVNNGEGVYENIDEIMAEASSKRLRELGNDIEGLEDLAAKTDKMMRDRLEPFRNKLKPTSVHFDVFPANCRYREDGELVLIDWDNAVLLPWQMEMAVAMHWSHEPETMKQAFLKEYNDEGFTEDEIVELVETFQTYQAILLLNHYLKGKGDKKRFKETLDDIKSVVYANESA